uniref:Uncharacterized protein n=1 Tax=Mycena chlorophos TaxID=658473 RepID=A0ABQ0KV91_MYCCL|nr:predicted protein [Mycena chlorophos]
MSPSGSAARPSLSSETTAAAPPSCATRQRPNGMTSLPLTASPSRFDGMGDQAFLKPTMAFGAHRHRHGLVLLNSCICTVRFAPPLAPSIALVSFGRIDAILFH